MTDFNKNTVEKRPPVSEFALNHFSLSWIWLHVREDELIRLFKVGVSIRRPAFHTWKCCLIYTFPGVKGLFDVQAILYDHTGHNLTLPTDRRYTWGSSLALQKLPTSVRIEPAVVYSATSTVDYTTYWNTKFGLKGNFLITTFTPYFMLSDVSQIL